MARARAVFEILLPAFVINADSFTSIRGFHSHNRVCGLYGSKGSVPAFQPGPATERFLVSHGKLTAFFVTR